MSRKRTYSLAKVDPLVNVDNFQIQYGVTDESNRTFSIENEIPWFHFSHGKLRNVEKMIQIELFELFQISYLQKSFGLMQNNKPKKTKTTTKGEGEGNPCCNTVSYQSWKIKYQKEAEATFELEEEDLEEILNQPLMTSNFGIDFPQANCLLGIKCGDTDYQLSLQKPIQNEMKKTNPKKDHDSADLYSDDLLYSRKDSKNLHYILDLWGFYISPRRGTRPTIITSVLREPVSRSIGEIKTWKNWIESNPLLLYPDQNQLASQILQVERHSTPFYYLSSRFHPSIPYLQDPDVTDEHLYVWAGWKPFENYIDLNFENISKKKNSLSSDPIEQFLVQGKKKTGSLDEKKKKLFRSNFN